MSIVETLRPTISVQDSTGGGYVLDPALAFDVNPATYSRVIAENAGEYGAQILSGFAADSFPDGRISVVLELDLAKFGWTALDVAYVHFRPSHSDVWSSVAAFFPADLLTVSTPKAIDVTAIAGDAPATGFEVSVLFANDTTGLPPKPQG